MTSVQKKKIRLFQRCLLAWYKKNRRDLPWRKTHDPYRILVSEIMLQQTQVDRVIPKYRAFLKTFSTVRALARATSTEVIYAWSGLGYNRRALFLKKAAEAIMTVHHGKFPRSVQDLEALPGIGKYTARAVLCFAYNQPLGFVDTNVARVLHRAFYGSDIPRRRVNEKKLWAFAEKIVPKGKADIWHHALMDFGALVCTARKPRCATSSFKNFFPACKEIARIDWKKEKLQKRVQPFRDSDRYIRGRIIEQLRTAKHHRASLVSLRRTFASHCTTQRFHKIISGLIRDHLLVWRGKYIAFP